MRVTIWALLASIALFFLSLCQGRLITTPEPSQSEFPRPDYTEYARMVRWLVHLNTWGSLATINKKTGRPSGGVVSISDGPWGNSTGRLIMYLTPMDYTAQDLEANPIAALVLTESQLMPDGCHDTDPENPTCAKVEVVGRAKHVAAEEVAAVQKIMFSRHPEMEDWPRDHHFYFLELVPEAFHLLDYFGGVHTITPEDYFAVDLSPQERAEH